jgi:deoxyribodipyrimidine photo-lyase
MERERSQPGGASVVWFRLDLRLEDNPALHAAWKRDKPIIPVFIWAPDEEAPWPPGAASRWWLHRSLSSLAEDLRQKGAELVLRRGSSLSTLLDLARETGADAVYWNRRYEPAVVRRDQEIKSQLREAGLHAESFNSALLREPWEIRNKSGKPFQVFSAFWRSCLASGEPGEPLPAPGRLEAVPERPASLPLDALELNPQKDWAGGFGTMWHPGSGGAAAHLDRFLERAAATYDEARNRPDLPGTSRLSPHLHFGEIGPRQLWRALEQFGGKRPIAPGDWRRWQFVTELGWREFAHHLLFHFPHTPDQPLRPEFAHFPWRPNPDRLRAWQRGRTGFPLVDAGLRELWATGWMHNRVRMVVASFLVKNLLTPWQEGARWFWDTLVDADLANNTLGWQWTAGSGADAAPYFRVFNPVAQGEKFDPQAAYVRRWIPQLSAVETKHAHQPGSAAEGTANPYPPPIVSPFASRQVALEAYERMKQQARRNAGK